MVAYGESTAQILTVLLLLDALVAPGESSRIQEEIQNIAQDCMFQA